jgi:hypothetical protein
MHSNLSVSADPHGPVTSFYRRRSRRDGVYLENESALLDWADRYHDTSNSEIMPPIRRSPEPIPIPTIPSSSSPSSSSTANELERMGSSRSSAWLLPAARRGGVDSATQSWISSMMGNLEAGLMGEEEDEDSQEEISFDEQGISMNDIFGDMSSD